MLATAAIAGAAIYPVPYAARLVGLDANTARRWARGHSYTYKGERRQAAPVVQLTRPEDADPPALTFEELLTLRLVRAFREAGLGLPTIKKAVRFAVERFNTANPFVSRAFRSDGRAVFIDLQQRGDVPGQERVMVNALTGQQQFREVVEPSLFEDVVFFDDKPREWFPIGIERSVVIRPDRAFGAPHVRNRGVRTDVLADAVAAEGGGDGAVKAVADWFDVSEDEVRDAVAAEEGWRTPQAA